MSLSGLTGEEADLLPDPMRMQDKNSPRKPQLVLAAGLDWESPRGRAIIHSSEDVPSPWHPVRSQSDDAADRTANAHTCLPAEEHDSSFRRASSAGLEVSSCKEAEDAHFSEMGRRWEEASERGNSDDYEGEDDEEELMRSDRDSRWNHRPSIAELAVLRSGSISRASSSSSLVSPQATDNPVRPASDGTEQTNPSSPTHPHNPRCLSGQQMHSSEEKLTLRNRHLDLEEVQQESSTRNSWTAINVGSPHGQPLEGHGMTWTAINVGSPGLAKQSRSKRKGSPKRMHSQDPEDNILYPRRNSKASPPKQKPKKIDALDQWEQQVLRGDALSSNPQAEEEASVETSPPAAQNLQHHSRSKSASFHQERAAQSNPSTPVHDTFARTGSAEGKMRVDGLISAMEKGFSALEMAREWREELGVEGDEAGQAQCAAVSDAAQELRWWLERLKGTVLPKVEDKMQEKHDKYEEHDNLRQPPASAPAKVSSRREHGGVGYRHRKKNKPQHKPPSIESPPAAPNTISNALSPTSRAAMSRIQPLQFPTPPKGKVLLYHHSEESDEGEYHDDFDDLSGAAEQQERQRELAHQVRMLEMQVATLELEKDKMYNSYKAECRHREHYKKMTNRLVEKMSAVLETLKYEHAKKLENSYEQLAITEVEKERYSHLYENEALMHLEYKEAFERLEKDYRFLRQSLSYQCSSTCENSLTSLSKWAWALCCRFSLKAVSSASSPPLHKSPSHASL